MYSKFYDIFQMACSTGMLFKATFSMQDNTPMEVYVTNHQSTPFDPFPYFWLTDLNFKDIRTLIIPITVYQAYLWLNTTSFHRALEASK